MNARVLREERAHHHPHAVVPISVNGVKTPARLRAESFPVSSAGFVQGNDIFLTDRQLAGWWYGITRNVPHNNVVRLREAHER